MDLLPLPTIKALLKQCDGRDLMSRRDPAITRLLIDMGGRLSEIGDLTVEDLDLEQDLVAVLGKGGRPRLLPIGSNTSLALSRYIRVRATHRHAKRRELWLGDKNRPPMTGNGLKLMLRRRGRRVRPHAVDGLAVPADAAPVRRELGRRTSEGFPPAARTRRPDLAPCPGLRHPVPKATLFVFLVTSTRMAGLAQAVALERRRWLAMPARGMRVCSPDVMSRAVTSPVACSSGP